MNHETCLLLVRLSIVEHSCKVSSLVVFLSALELPVTVVGLPVTVVEFPLPAVTIL